MFKAQLGSRAGSSPLYKMPAKLTTQPTSLREREKGKHNLCSVVFSWTHTLAEIRACPPYFCIGISGEVKAYSCSKSITTAAPHQQAYM